jgi:uncharacterized protein (TIGR02757 family)
VARYQNQKLNEKLSKQELKELLDDAVLRYNKNTFIDTDPISIPHLFKKKEDIEIAGLLTAIIAWGQRKTLISNAENLMNLMDNAPYQFLMGASSNDLKRMKNFVHRTFNGDDCIFLLQRLQKLIKKEGALEKLFITPNGDVKSGIINFREKILGIDYPQRVIKHISNPAKGSAAKRINMFLRWMIRKDNKGVDFGIWKVFEPSQLICPLDVHSGTVARILGLLERKQNDWLSAELLTASLREFDAKDPVKYDFALFGLGAFDKINDWPNS